MGLKKYLPPNLIVNNILIEYSIAQSSASVSGGTSGENYQPEISDWTGTDLNSHDGYDRGDI